MSVQQGIQKRTQQGGHSCDAGNGDPITLKRNEIGDFQRGIDAYLKKRGLTQRDFQRGIDAYLKKRGLTQHPFKRKKGKA